MATDSGYILDPVDLLRRMAEGLGLELNVSRGSCTVTRGGQAVYGEIATTALGYVQAFLQGYEARMKAEGSE